MKTNKVEKNECENCEGDFDNLVTIQNFQLKYGVTWVCSSCFLEIEGVSWTDYRGVRSGREL